VSFVDNKSGHAWLTPQEFAHQRGVRVSSVRNALSEGRISSDYVFRIGEFPSGVPDELVRYALSIRGSRRTVVWIRSDTPGIYSRHAISGVEYLPAPDLVNIAVENAGCTLVAADLAKAAGRPISRDDVAACYTGEATLAADLVEPLRAFVERLRRLIRQRSAADPADLDSFEALDDAPIPRAEHLLRQNSTYRIGYAWLGVDR